MAFLLGRVLVRKRQLTVGKFLFLSAEDIYRLSQRALPAFLNYKSSTIFRIQFRDV